MADEPVMSKVTEARGLTFSFYVGPRLHGEPETARSRAVIDGAGQRFHLSAAELDRMAMEWLNARGKFDLAAFTAALAAEYAEIDAADAVDQS